MTEGTCIYLIYGIEVCPKTKRTHHQGFCYFSGQRGSIKGVSKDLGKCHVSPCKGNIDQNIDYCSKDENVIEMGSRPQQGERVDLNKLKDGIMNNTLTVDDITVTDPMAYHMYGRTLNRLEDIALRKLSRTEMTQGLWLWGTTATGKSHMAYEGFTPDTHYDFPNDNGWWDGYKGQDTVIINDFRGSILFSELLTLVDKWPKSVRRRGREPVPFISKKVIITSCSHPSEIYHNACDSTDSMDQLLRRFKIVKLDQKWFEGNTDLKP